MDPLQQMREDIKSGGGNAPPPPDAVLDVGGRPRAGTPTIDVRSEKAAEPSVIQRDATVGEAFIGDETRHVGGLKRFIPEALATALPALIPGAQAGAPLWRKMLPLLYRAGMAELGYQSGRSITMQAPEYGEGSYYQIPGDIVTGVLGFAMSPNFRNAFARRTSSALMEALQAEVPAFRSLPKTDKGLYRAALDDGPTLLRERFIADIEQVKNQIPQGQWIQVSPDTLAALHASKETAKSEIASRTPQIALQPGFIEVDARQLIDNLPNLRKIDPGEHRLAVAQLAAQLPATTPGLLAAKRAYKWGAGWIDFATKGRFLEGERYNPNRAMAALDKYGADELNARGMENVRRIVRGPGLQPMEAEKMTPWATHRAAAEAGGMLGPAGRAVGGIMGFFAPEHSIYRNVPRGRAGQWMQRAGGAALAEAARLAGEGPEEPPTVRFRYDPATGQFEAIGGQAPAAPPQQEAPPQLPQRTSGPGPAPMPPLPDPQGYRGQTVKWDPTGEYYVSDGYAWRRTR